MATAEGTRFCLGRPNTSSRVRKKNIATGQQVFGLDSRPWAPWLLLRLLTSPPWAHPPRRLHRGNFQQRHRPWHPRRPSRCSSRCWPRRRPADAGAGIGGGDGHGLTHIHLYGHETLAGANGSSFGSIGVVDGTEAKRIDPGCLDSTLKFTINSIQNARPNTIDTQSCPRAFPNSLAVCLQREVSCSRTERHVATVEGLDLLLFQTFQVSAENSPHELFIPSAVHYSLIIRPDELPRTCQPSALIPQKCE
ncbi:uncharacterized protein LOC112881322 [Panicum hallii]|uniref:uncharacterized protein LOC112881322 n=1 Tax=Panicum hallii TaxID=206008 RepID=UPI000DF4D640|nr:uncharacterized protein LOC112881322 [Panicum hallii]